LFYLPLNLISYRTEASINVSKGIAVGLRIIVNIAVPANADGVSDEQIVRCHSVPLFMLSTTACPTAA
jgi:hypothetical protein